MKLLKGLVLAAAFATMATPASAAIIYTDLGVVAPPATLGSYTMTAFGADPQPAGGSSVTSVATPIGGVITFDSAMQHFTVGGGWLTWSHGYTGDVYYTGGLTTAGITLDSVGAFYLYVEPNVFGFADIEVCSGTVCSTQSIDGFAGARGFGFHDSGGTPITSISITSGGDFAIGEFGIAAPEPATLALLGLGVAGAVIRRRRA